MFFSVSSVMVGPKKQDFWPKINIGTQRNLLYFWMKWMTVHQKVPKSDFQSPEFFWFFSIMNNSSGENFLPIIFMIFVTLYFLKVCPIFSKKPFLVFSKWNEIYHDLTHCQRNSITWLTLYNTYLNFMLHYIQHVDLFWIISIWMMLPWITASVILIKFFCHSSSRCTHKNICALKQTWFFSGYL